MSATISRIPKVAVSEPAASINPMIDEKGDPHLVSTALEAIAGLLDQRQDVRLDEVQSYGVSILLKTCTAALRSMHQQQSKEVAA